MALKEKKKSLEFKMSEFKMPGAISAKPATAPRPQSKPLEDEKTEVIKEKVEWKVEFEEPKSTENSFKMPSAKLLKPATASLPDLEPVEDKKPEVTKEKVEIKEDSKITEMLNYSKKRSAPQIEYNEPSWSGLPPSQNPYFIEELKNGTIVEEHKLIGKNYFVIGKLPNNDIKLEHPSISRHHALLQYKKEESEDQPVGFYLYDLGSTHGTFHNKKQCFKKTYYRLRVGHAIKVAGSSRLLIVQGN